MSSKKILYATTSPRQAASYLHGQLAYMRRAGHEVLLLTGQSEEEALHLIATHEGVRTRTVPITRHPAPPSDLIALVHLCRLFDTEKPDAVILGTPKMSTLGLIAAWWTRVPLRIYLCHGLRFEGSRGCRRALLRQLERLNIALSTDTVAVGSGVRDALRSLGHPAKVRVLAYGSPNGVDTQRFSPSDSANQRASRASLGLASDATAICFIGRLTRDKGTATLLALAQTLTEKHPLATLILAGEPEPHDRQDHRCITKLLAMPNVLHVPYTKVPETVYAASTLLVLPTRREGLPTVILEANSCGIPVVAYDVTGTSEAIDHGVNGLLVEPDQQKVFCETVCGLVENLSLSGTLGNKGRHFVLKRFDQFIIWEAWLMLLESQSTEEGPGFGP